MSTGTPEMRNGKPGAGAPLRMVADIGGTHARFALSTSARDIHSVQVLETTAYPTLRDAAARYLEDQGNPPVRRAAIGIATPILGDQVSMTNSPWTFSIRETEAALGLEQLHVLNDFAALAMALPYLPEGELEQVGGDKAVPDAPRALLGPGTGLGVSALIPVPRGHWMPLASEGGHVRFAPADDIEAMIWRNARAEFGNHVSLERLASGPGLAFIHECLCKDRGVAHEPLSPVQISERAIDGSDPVSRQALDIFCAILGTAAGDLAVTLGARGGIYIGGGIVKKLGDYFAQSPFRARFEDKGRFRAYVAPIPVHVIQSKHPALAGSAAWLDQHESD